MKTSIISMLALSLALTSCVKINTERGENGKDGWDVFSGNEGKEPITDKTVEGEIDEIKVSTSIDAEIFKSNTEKVVVSAPADIMQYIKVENNAGKVRIYIKSDFGKSISTKNVKAKFYVKDFTKVVADSSGDIKIVDAFTQDKVEINVYSSGNIEATNLEANNFKIDVNSSGDFSGKIWAVNLEANASSSGDIIIHGKAKNATLQSSSSGDVKAKELMVENANLEASSSGDIAVSVSKSLNARATSSGEITVYKNGNLEQSNIQKSSAGNVYLK